MHMGTMKLIAALALSASTLCADAVAAQSAASATRTIFFGPVLGSGNPGSADLRARAVAESDCEALDRSAFRPLIIILH